MTGGPITLRAHARVARRWLFTATLATAIAWCAAPARAQNSAPSNTPAASAFTPNDARIISDPLYLPLAGQFYGATAYTLDRPHGDNFKNGVNTGSFQASNSLVDQTLAYGVTNDLTLRFGIGYGVHKRDSTAAATGDVTTGNASGFNDPSISATYRVLEEPRSPLVLDLTLAYSPDAFASQSSGGGQDGTLGRGGQNTGFSVAVGRETAEFTVAGTAGATYVGQQMTDLLANSTTSESDAHWSYSVALNTQTRFSDRLSLNIGVGYGSDGNYAVSNVQKGNAHTYDAPNTRSVNLAVNYHISRDRLVGAFTYAYNSLSAATNVFANAASDTAVANRAGNVVGARLMYLFN